MAAPSHRLRAPIALIVVLALLPVVGTAAPSLAEPRPEATLGSRTFRDFHSAEGTIDGLVLREPVVRGQGVGRTVLKMRRGSSTHARDVPARFPATNQMSLVRLGPSVRAFSGVTVQGTRQGHLYNGLRIDRTRDLRVSDVRIANIPGGDSAPPGETFGLNDYRSVGSRYDRIDIDGAGVGAAGFGVNNSRDVLIRRSRSHDNPYSMGFAFWQVRNIRIVRSTAVDNGRSGFNFERVSGTIRLERIRSLRNAYPVSIVSDQGSAKVTVVDPVLTNGRFLIRVGRTYYGNPNKQKRSDIRLIVDGRVRNDLLRFTT